MKCQILLFYREGRIRLFQMNSCFICHRISDNNNIFKSNDASSFLIYFYSSSYILKYIQWHWNRIYKETELHSFACYTIMNVNDYFVNEMQCMNTTGSTGTIICNWFIRFVVRWKPIYDNRYIPLCRIGVTGNLSPSHQKSTWITYRPIRARYQVTFS